MDTLTSSPQTPQPASDPAAATVGLSESEAAARLAAAGGSTRKPASSRSYRSIVRANTLTVFNLILAVFGAVTLAFGDWRDALFLGVIVANTTIGIAQEVRAKHALDRLALLVAPRACALRDGREREIAVEQVVVGDLLRVGPGDQIVADGRLVGARELRVDESVLTGEPDAVAREPGEQVRSGAFVVEGAGDYLVQAVGENSFAARIVGQARSFRHPRSPLEQAINRLLYGLVALMIGLGAVLGYSLYHRHASIHDRRLDVGGGRRQPRARGPDRAPQPHLRGGVRADGAARRARPAAERDRVTGLRAGAVRGQDRHADRVGAARRRFGAGDGRRRRRVGGDRRPLRRIAPRRATARCVR